MDRLVTVQPYSPRVRLLLPRCTLFQRGSCCEMWTRLKGGMSDLDVFANQTVHIHYNEIVKERVALRPWTVEHKKIDRGESPRSMVYCSQSDLSQASLSPSPSLIRQLPW